MTQTGWPPRVDCDALGQRATALLGNLLADRVAVGRGQYDRLDLRGHGDLHRGRLRRKQSGRVKRQCRGSEMGAKRCHGQRCNASVLNVK